MQVHLPHEIMSMIVTASIEPCSLRLLPRYHEAEGKIRPEISQPEDPEPFTGYFIYPSPIPQSYLTISKSFLSFVKDGLRTKFTGKLSIDLDVMLQSLPDYVRQSLIWNTDLITNIFWLHGSNWGHGTHFKLELDLYAKYV